MGTVVAIGEYYESLELVELVELERAADTAIERLRAARQDLRSLDRRRKATARDFIKRIRRASLSRDSVALWDTGRESRRHTLLLVLNTATAKADVLGPKRRRGMSTSEIEAETHETRMITARAFLQHALDSYDVPDDVLSDAVRVWRTRRHDKWPMVRKLARALDCDTPRKMNGDKEDHGSFASWVRGRNKQVREWERKSSKP